MPMLLKVATEVVRIVPARSCRRNQEDHFGLICASLSGRSDDQAL